MDIPAHNTINPARCPESPLWSAANLNMASVRKMPYIRGLRTATSNACPLCSLEDSGSYAADTKTWSRATLQGTIKLADWFSRQAQRGQMATTYSSLPLAHKKTCMQEVPWMQVCLLGLTQETTISEMRQDGENKDRTTDSLGITAPEDQLKMRPDIMTHHK